MLILWSNLVRTEKLGKFDHHHISGFGICKDQHQARTSWCTFYIAHVCNFFGSKMTSFRFDINYQIVVSLVTRMHVLPPPPRMVGAGRSLKASPRNVEIHVFLYEFGATKALLCLLTHAFFHTSLVLVEKNRLRRCQQSFWALSSSFFFFLTKHFHRPCGFTSLPNLQVEMGKVWITHTCHHKRKWSKILATITGSCYHVYVNQ